MSQPMKVPTPTPPLKGSFPLDHSGRCKYEVIKYLMCLNKNKNVNEACRDLAKSYFECRMDTGLMERDGWDHLGYHDRNSAQSKLE